MKRREFNASLLTAGLSAPAILTGSIVEANTNQDEGGTEFAAFSRLILVLALGQFLIDYLIIMNSSGLIGLDLRKPMPQFEENRADVSRIPLIGSLQRPTIEKEFRNASVVGAIYLLSNMLFVLPDNRQLLNLQKIVFLHRAISYRPTQKPKKVRLQTVPTINQIVRTGTLLGNVYRNQGKLFLPIDPLGVKFR